MCPFSFYSLWILANGSMVGLCSAICIKHIGRCEREMKTDMRERHILYKLKLLNKMASFRVFVFCRLPFPSPDLGRERRYMQHSLLKELINF